MILSEAPAISGVVTSIPASIGPTVKAPSNQLAIRTSAVMPEAAMRSTGLR